MSVEEGSNRTEAAQSSYRPDIDGLRAIAILAVLGYHAFPNWIRGGFVGVDVFFVISGYLISSIIFSGLASGNFSFGNFYARRIRRIFPALILVLVTSYFFGAVALFSHEYSQLAKHIAAGSGFVSNLVFWSEAGYFDISGEKKVLLHLWSLGVEEQFYILWPLLVYIAWLWRRSLLLVTLLAAFASLAYGLAIIKSDTSAAFYSPVARFWEILLGALLAYTHVWRDGRIEQPFGAIGTEEAGRIGNLRSCRSS